jgi:hypothetical protein
VAPAILCGGAGDLVAGEGTTSVVAPICYD